jgi:hypothetical protein
MFMHVYAGYAKGNLLMEMLISIMASLALSGLFHGVGFLREV